MSATSCVVHRDNERVPVQSQSLDISLTTSVTNASSSCIHRRRSPPGRRRSRGRRDHTAHSSRSSSTRPARCSTRSSTTRRCCRTFGSSSPWSSRSPRRTSTRASRGRPQPAAPLARRTRRRRLAGAPCTCGCLWRVTLVSPDRDSSWWVLQYFRRKKNPKGDGDL